MKKVKQQKKAKQERKREKRKWKSSFCHAKTQNTLQNLSTKHIQMNKTQKAWNTRSTPGHKV